MKRAFPRILNFLIFLSSLDRCSGPLQDNRESLMSLMKEKVRLDCESCRYCGDCGADSFQLEVPIEDQLTGLKGNALIQCEVSDFGHRVTLVHFRDPAGNALVLNEDQNQRLGRLLHLIAEKKICGNEGLCPREVVERVRSSLQPEVG